VTIHALLLGESGNTLTRLGSGPPNVRRGPHFAQPKPLVASADGLHKLMDIH
jgi:hypothetical protein